MSKRLLATACLATAGPAVAQPSMSRTTLLERFDVSLARLAREGLFSGTVVIARDGVPVLERAYGVADRATGRPVTVATRVNVGSMNKMFTAVAVLQLARAGRISLEGRLIDILPSYPNAAVAGRVTIHQLLTHTAGVGDFLMKMLAAPPREYQRLEDYLPYFVNDDLAFEPGSRWAYSNGGYLILGLVIEAVTGRPYAEVIRDSILAKAGMSGHGVRTTGAKRGVRDQLFQHAVARQGGARVPDAGARRSRGRRVLEYGRSGAVRSRSESEQLPGQRVDGSAHQRQD